MSSATPDEKRAVRDLCVAKRKLTQLDRETKAKRKKWNAHVQTAKKELERLLPNDTCYKVGSQYIRRDVYNRMTPIEIAKVKEMLVDISTADVEAHSKYSATNPWPAFLDILKRRVNADRNRRGEYIRTTTQQPRRVTIVEAPREVLEIATLQERAKQQLKQIAEEVKPRRSALQSQMTQLEPDVMRFMARTKKERQRVRIGDSLAGGGTVNHNFSILRKQRKCKPKITMDHVFQVVQDVMGTRSFQDFRSNRTRLAVRIGQVLGDIVQPSAEFYLQLRTSGIQEQ